MHLWERERERERERGRRVTNMMRGFMWGREREWSTVREEDWISELRLGLSRASSATSMAFQIFTAPIFLSFWLFSFIYNFFFFLQFATLLICPLLCAKSLKTRKFKSCCGDFWGRIGKYLLSILLYRENVCVLEVRTCACYKGFV